MELTGLKNIQNTGEVNEENLPGYSIGKIFKKGGFLGEGGDLDKFLGYKNDTFGTNGAAIGTAATGVLDMVGSIGAASKFNRTADDLLRDAGTSLNNIGGVGYTVQNGLDDKQIEQETNAESTSSTLGLTAKGAATGAAIASVIPGVGTAVGGIVGGVAGLVGGLFGGGAKKREMKRQMRLAEIKRINTNSFNQSGALTTVLQNNLALTEGNQEDQALYSAANGKESYSAGGPTSGYNARVSNGEIIANKFTGEMFRVPGIPNNKDGKLAFIRPSDTIISNKYGLSDYVANTGDLEGGEAMQGTIMKALGKRGYKNGKLPGFKWGLPEWANLGVNAFGALSSIADANSIAREEISKPDFRVKLQNAPLTNLMMLSRHENAYPIMQEYYNSLAKLRYNIRNTYGLSQAQRAMADIAGEAQTRESMGRLLTEQQRSNNSMIADAARFMAQQDATQAQLDQRGDIEGYDRYDRAHGAKRLIESQHKADAMKFLLQGVKGITDMHMWRRMMDNYDREFEVNHPESTSTNVPKVSLDPNGLFRNANFAGTKSYAINPLAGTVEAGRPLPEFTAPTPREIDRFKNHQMPLLNVAFPQYWTTPTDKSYLDVSPISKLPISSTKSTVKPTTFTKTEKKSKSTKTSASVPDWYVMPKNAGSEYYKKRYGSDEAAREAYWKLYKYWENNR